MGYPKGGVVYRIGFSDSIKDLFFAYFESLRFNVFLTVRLLSSRMVSIIRSRSALVMAVPEGRQSPLLNKSSAIVPPTTLAGQLCYSLLISAYWRAFLQIPAADAWASLRGVGSTSRRPYGSRFNILFLKCQTNNFSQRFRK
jgi:hypothetical protein